MSNRNEYLVSKISNIVKELKERTT